MSRPPAAQDVSHQGSNQADALERCIARLDGRLDNVTGKHDLQRRGAGLYDARLAHEGDSRRACMAAGGPWGLANPSLPPGFSSALLQQLAASRGRRPHLALVVHFIERAAPGERELHGLPILANDLYMPVGQERRAAASVGHHGTARCTDRCTAPARREGIGSVTQHGGPVRYRQPWNETGLARAQRTSARRRGAGLHP